MPYIYDYPRPALTVDCILISKENGSYEVLLIQRKNPPFQDHWAFPGGFVDMDEDLETAAIRELEEETGVSGIEVEQICTVGTPGRDPRGRTVSVIYLAYVQKSNIQAAAASDAKKVGWFPIDQLPLLAFDHGKIMQQLLLKINS